MNPNENDFTRDEPLPAQQFPPPEESIGSTGREQFRRATEEVSTQMSQTWDQTKETASRALERTEDFVRENPVPTILGALGLGIAIGLAIRYAVPSERKHEIEVKSPLGDFNWSLLSLPFLLKARILYLPPPVSSIHFQTKHNSRPQNGPLLFQYFQE